MSCAIAIYFRLFADWVQFGLAVTGRGMVRTIKFIVVDPVSISTGDEIHLAG